MSELWLNNNERAHYSTPLEGGRNNVQQPSELCYPIIMVSSKLAAKFKASLQSLPPASAPVVAEGTAQAAPAAVPSRGEGSPAPGGVGAGGRPAASPRTTVRPDVLKGREKISPWLRAEAAAVLASQVSPKTVEQYERNGARLHAARALGKPVDLSNHTGSASTFYAYRAAVRWYAATHGAQAVRDYDNARRREDEDGKAEAWQRVLHFAADLVQYPKDAKPGLPNAEHVALGLDDAKPEGAPTRAKRERGGGDVAKRETAKLKAANGIARRCPDWRARVWARLVAINSPWLDHTAIAALTGARPEELRTAQVLKTREGIEIAITGAKVSDTKGQPWRKFSLRDDGSDEYAHMLKIASKTWKPIPLPDGVTDYPDAFSAALARAGAQVLPGNHRLSGYVYRHAFASDLKADGASREQLAQALGHAVTKTQDAYGRAIGGAAGRRLVSVSAAREVRATHDTRYTNPAPQIAPQAMPAQPAGDGFVIDKTPPVWQSPGWSDERPT